MSHQTRIIILKMKEIIYTVIFILFMLVLIFLLIYMFGAKKETKNADEGVQTSTYTPGTYTSSIILNDNKVDISVTVDENNIKDVSIVNLEESVAAMYPLLTTAVDDISSQLSQGKALTELNYDPNSK